MNETQEYQMFLKSEDVERYLMTEEDLYMELTADEDEKDLTRYDYGVTFPLHHCPVCETENAVIPVKVNNIHKIKMVCHECHKFLKWGYPTEGRFIDGRSL